MKELNRSPEHKKVLKMMIDHDITQKEVADYLDVTPQAVNNRLKRGSIEPIVEAINELAGINAGA
jgi:predicted transcriptional regulator